MHFTLVTNNRHGSAENGSFETCASRWQAKHKGTFL
jgi:hypothetical protein